MNKTILKILNNMNTYKLLFITICFSFAGCAFTTSETKSEEQEEQLNIYAENSKGGYLLIKTNNSGDAYLKMRGSNYSNHYFGTLKKSNDTIKFIPKTALSLHKCKSGKYGDNNIGVAFGNDQKALDFLKKFTMSYKSNSMSESKGIQLNGLQNYFELSEEENILITIESKENKFLKLESIDLDPKTTMLCVDSRNRSSEFQFVVNGDKTEATNYFGRPQSYSSKESPY